MLALVKKPHIELSMTGEHLEELLAWIRKKFDIAVVADEPDDELVPIESTGFWKEMERNRVGNLLAGARLKAGLTQAQLAEKLGIRQNMVSDYERGRRTYSDAMATRLSKVLHVREERLGCGRQKPAATDTLVREIRELGASYRTKAKDMLADVERMRDEDDPDSALPEGHRRARLRNRRQARPPVRGKKI